MKLVMIVFVTLAACHSRDAAVPARSAEPLTTTAHSSAASLQPRQSSREERIEAAAALTAQYANSRLADWKIRARAGGADCDILTVHTSVIMEDSMVEALHYGAGAYDVYDGGIEQFYKHERFRGVIYKDATNHPWMYGSIGAEDGAATCQ